MRQDGLFWVDGWEGRGGEGRAGRVVPLDNRGRIGQIEKCLVFECFVFVVVVVVAHMGVWQERGI